MAITLRTILSTSIPALVAILGFIWFSRKKKPDAIEEPKPKPASTRPKEAAPTTQRDVSPIAASSLMSEQIPLSTVTPLLTETPQDNRKKIKSDQPLKPPDNKNDPVIHTEKEDSQVKGDIKQERNQDLLLTKSQQVKQNATPSVPNPDAVEVCQNVVQSGIPTESVPISDGKNSASAPVDVKMNSKPEEMPASEGKTETETVSNADTVSERKECGQGDFSESNVSNSVSDVSNSAPISAVLCESGKDLTTPDVSSGKEDQAVTATTTKSSISVDPADVKEEDICQNFQQVQNDAEETTEVVAEEPAPVSGVSEASSGTSNNTQDKVDQDNATENNNIAQSISSVAVNGAEQENKDKTEVVEDWIENEEVSAVTAAVHPGVASCSSSVPSSVGSPVEGSTANGVNGSHSDAQSESADSGNGSSILSPPPPQMDPESSSSLPPMKAEYSFDFPADMCGLLIGRRGANIKDLKERSGCEITVKEKMYTNECKLVSLEGSQRAIDRALDIIKKRFPPQKFGPIDFTPAQPENPILVPEIMQLSLPDGVMVDVNVSSVVTPNHLFLQQPTHPSFYMLEKQNGCMLLCYAQDGIVPQLPRPIEVGMICAAPMFNGWYRAQVVATFPETDECDIKYVDYGGYAKVQSCHLRQIRSDFTTLPFQAAECYLANVIPPKDELSFPLEASAILEELVHNQILQAEVMSYEEDGVPYLQLYLRKPDNTLVMVNRELVERGVARWMEQPL